MYVKERSIKERFFVACNNVGKALLVFMLLHPASKVKAQSTIYDSVNRKSDKINLSAVAGLTAWGVLNLSTGIIRQANTVGEQRQFYRTNAIAGGAELAIAGLSLLSMKTINRNTQGIESLYNKQEFLEKFFLFSTGLDVGLALLGLYTMEKANRFTGEKRVKFKGMGKSIIVHGAFLTLLDAVHYLQHTKNGNWLQKRLLNLSVAATENGIGVVRRF